MAYGVRLLVEGAYASFNRPEMKVERVSYEVMTPSAARGILEAIYWKPDLHWVVDEIHVLAPIAFTHIRRNELSCRISVRSRVAAAMRGDDVEPSIAVEDFRQQRAAMILRNVRYGIHAHLELRDDAMRSHRTVTPEAVLAAHLDRFRRRAVRGQFFQQPYLGNREFPATFTLTDEFPPCPRELWGRRELGVMLHDLDFIPDDKGKIIESYQGRRLSASARFFHAVLSDGVLRPPLRPRCQCAPER